LRKKKIPHPGHQIRKITGLAFKARFQQGTEDAVLLLSLHVVLWKLSVWLGETWTEQPEVAAGGMGLPSSPLERQKGCRDWSTDLAAASGYG